jgi:hypothetical protein
MQKAGNDEIIMWMLVLAFGAWTALISYVLWFIFKAKTVQPLTLDDLALTWKVHKQQSGCKSSRIHGLIKENDEIVGFQCDCGYEFIQKRLITQKPVEKKAAVSKKEEKEVELPKVGNWY